MYFLIFPFVIIGLTSKIANKKLSRKVLASNNISNDTDFNNIVKTFNHQSNPESIWGTIQNEDVRKKLQESELTK